MGRYRVARIDDLPPFVGGAVGYFGYDLVRHVERLPEPPPDDQGLPDMAFLVTDIIVVFDHLKHTITLLTNIFTEEEPDLDAAYQAAARRLMEVKARLRGPYAAARSAHGAARRTGGSPSTSTFEREDYEAAVERSGSTSTRATSSRWCCPSGSSARPR